MSNFFSLSTISSPGIISIFTQIKIPHRKCVAKTRTIVTIQTRWRIGNKASPSPFIQHLTKRIDWIIKTQNVSIKMCKLDYFHSSHSHVPQPNRGHQKQIVISLATFRRYVFMTSVRQCFFLLLYSNFNRISLFPWHFSTVLLQTMVWI